MLCFEKCGTINIIIVRDYGVKKVLSKTLSNLTVL
jgi:hypothetical protein